MYKVAWTESGKQRQDHFTSEAEAAAFAQRVAQAADDGEARLFLVVVDVNGQYERFCANYRAAGETGSDLPEGSEQGDIEVFIDLLGSAESGKVVKAAHALGALGDLRAADALGRAFIEGPDEARRDVAAALVALGSSAAVVFIDALSARMERAVRDQAAVSLDLLAGQGLLGEETIRPMAIAMQDPTFPRPWNLASALGKTGDVKAGRPLVRALKSGESDGLRNAAADALESILERLERVQPAFPAESPPE